MVEVKERNMVVQVLLMIITFGLYLVYWFYVTCQELVGLSDNAGVSPGVLTILLFVPIANLYAWYKYAELYETVSSDHMNRWVLFLLVLVFMPAVWFIVQTELNKRARGNEQGLSVGGVSTLVRP
ncbi:MAG: DUF4234 domain-containing protein [Deltaproteobacteria bacterium]|nr:DUF4234 domain-containing protein [Deltaproteobacteria bacterium]MBW1875995.1 DUF4234 domain-containing protein [Deltaproteobacteria bacterium]MBW2191767.1 DUF4234 domain-containing protein [Deltaproteobacteria bacterium]MBW2380776.1 DUF4234 domain-containing protein [Deltaproteobacteria bacterium]MBW2551811.1 DUF4234 domain-containing protein [Deltaproteobacteria bacterium]